VTFHVLICETDGISHASNERHLREVAGDVGNHVHGTGTG
jgi:hypothetical protein